MAIENNEEGGLDQFTRSYENFGILARPDGSVYCKEWCPGAQQLYLWGEFSNNSPLSHFTSVILRVSFAVFSLVRRHPSWKKLSFLKTHVCT
jgi:hypothetical protein